MDDGWYEMLVRDEVDLVTEGIREITPQGVVTVDGATHEFDVLVLATGYHAGKFLWPMEVAGKGGVLLHDRWEGGENPRAYLGITVPDFPNFFCLYGPNTNPVLGSVIYMLECQTTYVMGCLRQMIEKGIKSIDCSPEVLATGFNMICVYGVIRRRKYALSGDIEGMKSVAPLLRLTAAFLPTFAIAFALGVYFVVQ